MANTHWKLNKPALERLRRELGIRHPIHVQGSAAKRKHGSYHGLSAYTIKGKRLVIPHHQVALGSVTNTDRLCETVIHECVHALQKEREMAGGVKVPNLEYHARSERPPAGLPRSYWNDPIEVEARAVAAKMADNYRDLLTIVPEKEYVVTDRYGFGERYTVMARSPSAACQKVSKRRFGVTTLHTEFRARRA